MELRHSIVVAAVVLLLPAAALAGSSVSVREAVELALARNHLLKAAQFDEEAATQGTAASRSRYLPRIFLEETAAISNMPTRVFMMKLDEGRFTQNDFQIPTLNHPGSHGDFRTQVSLEQPLFDLGIGYGVEMAGREEEARRQALAARREEVALRVIGAWLDVQKETARLAATEKSLQDAREHVRLASVRGREGAGLKSDELRARTFLAEMEQQAITANNELLVSRMRLAQVTGGDAGTTLDIAGEPGVFPLDVNRDRLLQLAFAGRPDLKEMEKQAERADLAVRVARSAYFPTVYAGAAYQMNDRDIPFGRDNDSWAASATLRWELFDGLRRNNDLARARALHRSAAESLEEYRQQVVLEVNAAWLRREEAGKRLEVARQAHAGAEEVVRLVSRRFENSLATMADLLEAQAALNRVRAQVIENESNYTLSTARVYHAAGVLVKEVVK